MKSNNLSVLLLAIVALSVGYIGFQVSKGSLSFGGGYGLTSQDCDVITTTAVRVGPKTDDGDNVILATSSQRAWARIQARATSTPTITLNFKSGANATLGNGLAISGIGASNAGTGTTTPAYVDFGRNTDFPYTGTVTAINDSAATTSVLVTDCRY